MRVKCTECELELKPREVAARLGADKRPFCSDCMRLKHVPQQMPFGQRRKDRHVSTYNEVYEVHLVNHERKALNDPFLPYVRT